MPKMRLIEELTVGPLPTGTILLVEYDPTSQWYNACTTIMAGWLTTGGTVDHQIYARAADEVRAQFRQLGVQIERLEKEKRFEFVDFYTLTLGQKSNEISFGTLKIPEISITVSQKFMRGPPVPGHLVLSDDESTLTRFNDEKTFVEFELTRTWPGIRQRKGVWVGGLMAGIHSEWVYRRLEGGADGVVDFKLDESSGEPRDLIRIRSMRNMHFDRRWHQLKVGENFEVTLEN